MTEFETAFKKYRGDMLRAAQRAGMPFEQAEECVQEAGRKLSQMVTLSYTDTSKLRAFFCETARNEAINARVKDGAESQKESDPTIVGSIHVKPSRPDRQLMIGISVHKALASLPEVDAIIAWKFWGLGLNVQEITEDLAKEKGITWPRSSLDRHIRRSIKPRLMKRLKELDIER